MSDATQATTDPAAFIDLRDDGKVVQGKNGRLFLDNDTNEVVTQHTGALRLDEHGVEQWRLILEHRTAWLERRGVKYLFLVAPNAHSVYPEDLPDDVPSAPERTVHQVLGAVERGGIARVVYPLEELVREREKPVFPKTGSHWTEYGAFLAYRSVIDVLRESVPVEPITLDDLEWHEEERPGGLGHKVEPKQTSTFVFLDFKHPRARLVYDNRIRNNGRRVEFEGDDSAGLSCLVLGDSYARLPVPFLAESFRRLVFGHISTLDHELVEQERPDVVISVLSERFLIHPPVDVPSQSLAEHERHKREAGAVLPPRRVETNRLDFPR
jgi:alginate O-acetyltransferase complex protein AlgJ